MIQVLTMVRFLALHSALLVLLLGPDGFGRTRPASGLPGCAAVPAAQSSLGTNADKCAHISVPLIKDPGGVLQSAQYGHEQPRILELLQGFQRSIGGAHLGHWDAVAALAFVGGADRRNAQTVAEDTATAWQLHVPGHCGDGVVLALDVVSDISGDSAPRVAVAGSLLAAAQPPSLASRVAPPLRDSEELPSALTTANALLQAEKLADAVEVVLTALAAVVSAWPAGWPLQLSNRSGQESVRQQQLLIWQSGFQKGEVWRNACGDGPCLELWLDDIRQFSARFEAYYHEAMVFPALNLLGPARQRRVLVLGGGDCGAATHALRYDTVAEVVVVDIDARVTGTAAEWFAAVAGGLGDPRLRVVHGDAFAWVSRARGRGERFDLVVIDFTDAPVAGGLWARDFFRDVAGLLSGDGLLVQNMGNINMLKDGRRGGHLQSLFAEHMAVMRAVFPMSALIPDYESPYILALSGMRPDMDPLGDVDWAFWRRQGLDPLYYDGAAQHAALFAAVPAEVCAVLGLRTSERDAAGRLQPVPPRPVKRLLALRRTRSGGEVQVLFNTRDRTTSRWVQVHHYSHGGTPDLTANGEKVVGGSNAERDETMVFPALNLLGPRARRVVVLGGGSGALAALLLRWPSVQQVVLVELDAALVRAAREFFPRLAAALDDGRVELVMADALRWVAEPGRGPFDLVIVNWGDEEWHKASAATRIPRTRRFYGRLKALVAPGGLLVQEAGSMGMPRRFAQLFALHSQAFASTWPLALGALESFRNDRQELSGKWFRAPSFLLLSSPDDPALDPCDVDWQPWDRMVSSAAEDLKADPLTTYHISLHCALFVLPAELQRKLNAAPPSGLGSPRAPGRMPGGRREPADATGTDGGGDAAPPPRATPLGTAPAHDEL